MSNRSEDSSKPKLSVVVGSHNARSTIVDCLSAIQDQLNRQRGDKEVEVIVVDNSTDATAEIVGRRFPSLKLVSAPDCTFIPELWEVGISQSTGDIIAITTAHCVPTSNWIEEILKAHQSPSAGVGGAIENDESADLVQWAIYFLRYSPFMLPFPEETIREIAGDNASYKRRALDLCRDARRNGFWEPAVHRELRKNGLELMRTPAIVVCHKKSFSFAAFMNQRFWHGRQFGSARAATLPKGRRLFYVLASPLIPILFLARIARQIAYKRRNFDKFILCLPILMLFLLSWSFGELSGYLWISEKEATGPSTALQNTEGV